MTNAAERDHTRGQLVVVTGGVRSGKSTFAEGWAARAAAAGAIGGPAPRRGPLVAYVATGRAWDVEMTARVAAHRARRPAAWSTLEAPLRLADAVAGALAQGTRVVLVDSVDAWVSNRLLETEVVDATQLDHHRLAELERALRGEVEQMVTYQRRSHGSLLLVTLEAGMGGVPPYPLGRAFCDLQGRVNTALAAAADQVYLMIAGLPVELKRLSAAVAEDR